MANGFVAKGRCQAVLYSAESKEVMRCELQQGHHDSHRTHNMQRRLILFSNEDAQKSLEVVVEQQRQALQEAKRKLREQFNPVKSTTPLIGWRAWKLNYDLQNFGIRGVTMDYVWDTVSRTKDNMQVISQRLENNGDQGIHCYKTPKLVNEMLSHSYPVYGSIDLTGMVVEHVLGYRAQIATIREFWINRKIVEVETKYYPYTLKLKGVDWIAKRLEDRYQCPIHLVDDYDVVYEQMKAAAAQANGSGLTKEEPVL